MIVSLFFLPYSVNFIALPLYNDFSGLLQNGIAVFSGQSFYEDQSQHMNLALGNLILFSSLPNGRHNIPSPHAMYMPIAPLYLADSMLLRNRILSCKQAVDTPRFRGPSIYHKGPAHTLQKAGNTDNLPCT